MKSFSSLFHSPMVFVQQFFLASDKDFFFHLYLFLEKKRRVNRRLKQRLDVTLLAQRHKPLDTDGCCGFFCGVFLFLWRRLGRVITPHVWRQRSWAAGATAQPGADRQSRMLFDSWTGALWCARHRRRADIAQPLRGRGGLGSPLHCY